MRDYIGDWGSVRASTIAYMSFVYRSSVVPMYLLQTTYVPFPQTSPTKLMPGPFL